MKYNLVNAKQEAVKVSEDKKSINVDYTMTIEAVDENIKDEKDNPLKVPISEGITVSVAPQDFLQADKKAQEWFDNKYNKSI